MGGEATKKLREESVKKKFARSARKFIIPQKQFVLAPRTDLFYPQKKCARSTRKLFIPQQFFGSLRSQIHYTPK